MFYSTCSYVHHLDAHHCGRRKKIYSIGLWCIVLFFLLLVQEDFLADFIRWSSFGGFIRIFIGILLCADYRPTQSLTCYGPRCSFMRATRCGPHVELIKKLALQIANKLQKGAPIKLCADSRSFGKAFERKRALLARLIAWTISCTLFLELMLELLCSSASIFCLPNLGTWLSVSNCKLCLLFPHNLTVAIG